MRLSRLVRTCGAQMAREQIGNIVHVSLINTGTGTFPAHLADLYVPKDTPATLTSKWRVYLPQNKDIVDHCSHPTWSILPGFDLLPAVLRYQV